MPLSVISRMMSAWSAMSKALTTISIFQESLSTHQNGLIAEIFVRGLPLSKVVMASVPISTFPEN